MRLASWLDNGKQVFATARSHLPVARLLLETTRQQLLATQWVHPIGSARSQPLAAERSSAPIIITLAGSNPFAPLAGG